MAGGDDEMRIHGSMEGPLDDQLRRLEQRLQSVEGQLGETGEAGESAGDKISRGADKAESGLRDTSRAADTAAESLDDVRDRAERGAKALREAHDRGKAAAEALGEVGSEGRSAASGLDAAADNARDAAAGLTAAGKGAGTAASGLADTAREARGAARALDDAGDEAVESGAKAAASATAWERLAARMDRNDRISRRWAAAQGAMRWSAWSGAMGKFAGAGRSVAGIDWDKSSKGLGKLGKAFGGFGKVMMATKFGVIAGGVYALLGAISALGAGAVGALGGILSMVPALLAVAGVAVVAKLAILGIKAGLKETQPEVDALKKKFVGFGANVAAGGLREGLQAFTKDIDGLSRQTNVLGTEIGAASKYVLGAAGGFLSGTVFAQQYGVVISHSRKIMQAMGLTALNSGAMMSAGLAASMPAAQRLSEDLRVLTYRWAWQADALYQSGRMTQVVSQAYANLRRALAVVADWTVGLFRIFRIAAQESAWMGDSIERSAQKFRDWTGTIEGQNAIRDYFRNAMPAVREAGLLVRDIFMGFGKLAAGQDLAPLLNQIRTQLLPAIIDLAAQFNTNLLPGLVTLATQFATMFAGLDFSGLQVLVDLLIQFGNAILWAQANVPGFNFLLSTLLTTMFLLGPVATVLGKVFGVFSKIGSAFGWVATAARGTGELTRMQKIIGPAFQFVGRIAGWFGQVVGRALLWVFTAFSRLGGVMGILRMIGSGFMVLVGIIGWPVTLIIAAVVAIVAVFIYLWNNCQWFRDGVMNILSGIGNFFVTLWTVYVYPALSAIGNFFVTMWTGYIWPVLQALWTGLKWIAAILFTIVVGSFILAWKIISSIVMTVWYGVLWPILQAIGAAFVWIFQNVILPVVNFFVSAYNAYMALVAFAYYVYVLPALQAMGAFFSWLFDVVIGGVVRFFINLWNGICQQFQLFVNTIIVPALNIMGAIFNWVIMNIIAPVVGFLQWAWAMCMLSIQIAYVTYIVPMINAFGAIMNWLYYNVWLPIITFIQGLWNGLGTFLGYIYTTYIQPAFDSVMNGLGVVRDWFNSTVDGIAAIWDRLRGALAVPVNYVIDTVWNKGLLPAWNWVASKLGLPEGQPLAPIALATGGDVRGRGTGTSDSIPAMLSNGEHVWTAKEVRRAGGHDKVKQFRHMALAGSLGNYAGGGPVTPQEMYGVASAAIPGTQLTSGLRPGDSGWHGKNRAADLVGNMRAIDQFIGEKFPSSTQLIHTPGPYNILNGRPHTYNAGDRAGHYDHVHWVANGAAPGEGGGGGGGWFVQKMWDIGRPILDGILNPIIDAIPFNAPPEFMGVPKAMARKTKDELYKWAERELGVLDTTTGGGAAPGVGPVWDQIKSVASRWGWGDGPQWGSLSALIQKESSGNPTIKNPRSSAYGLFQFIDAAWGEVGGRKTDNPAEQTEYGLRYIKKRYTDPIGAWNFHRSRGWYDDGGYLPTGLSTVMNGTGKPEPVFTSGQWDILSGNLTDPFGGLLNGSGLVEAMLATPQSGAAVAASARDSGGHDALVGAVRELAGVLAERPPPTSVTGDETRREVERAWAEHERKARARRRYQYGDDH